MTGCKGSDGTATPCTTGTESISVRSPLNPKQQQQQEHGKTSPTDCQNVLNETNNVLVLFRLQDFQRRSNVNLWLAVTCLVCCGVDMVLLYLNYTLGSDSNHKPSISRRTFHMLEFWITFGYSLVEAFALLTSPKTTYSICNNSPTMLKLLFFINVIAALVPALLITLDLEFFEDIAHELEFINEFIMSLVTLILLSSLLKSNNTRSDASSLPMVIASTIVAAITFFVYNVANNEHAAHYWEFSFNILTSGILFWFCMDNRFVAEMEMDQILFGNHGDGPCKLCETSVIYLQRRTTQQWRTSYGTATIEAAAVSVDEDSQALLGGV